MIYEEEPINPMDIVAPMAVAMLAVLPVYLPTICTQASPQLSFRMLLEMILVVGTTCVVLIQMLLHFPSLSPVIYTSSMHCALHLLHHLQGLERIYGLPSVVIMAVRAGVVLQFVLAATFSKPLHPSTLATSHLASLVIPQALGYAVLGVTLLVINLHSRVVVD